MWNTISLLVSINLLVCIEAKKAYLDIILYEINQEDGRYLTHRKEIKGVFSSFGTANHAEGDIIQMHPHSLCDDSNNAEKFEYGWVGVVKLTLGAMDTCHLAEKARAAVRQGATAVIFDVSNHPSAFQLLNEHSFNSLNQPIVLVKGVDASDLMDIIEREQIARAVIKRGQPDQEPFGGGLRDPALLLSGLILILLVVFIILCKGKCTKRKQQRSLHNWMLQHTKKKTYQKQKHKVPMEFDNNTIHCYNSSVSSSGSLCAICLDAFIFGEDLRVLECQHEFHLDCIDLWLKQKRSCPLCNRDFSDIVEEFDQQNQSNTSQLNEVYPSTTVGQASSHQDSANFVETEQADDAEVLNYSGQEELSVNQSTDEDSTKSASHHVHRSHSSSEIEQGITAGTFSCEAHDTNIHIFGISHRKCDSSRPCVQHATTSNPTSTQNYCKKCNPVHFPEIVADSYFLRVEGYPVPHILNENCECISVSVPIQRSNCVTNSAISNICNCTNSSSSFDNTSILVHLGSIPTIHSGQRNSSSLSFSTNTSKQVEYYSDSSEIVESCTQLHRLTPCVEYSSSDGTSNFRCLSYSTLEDALAGLSEES